jgi:hypothetical protein
MCSSKNPPGTDERTTTKVGIVFYETNQPWVGRRAYSTTTSDMELIIQRYMGFSSIIYIKQTYFNAQTENSMMADINISDNY